MKKTIYSIAICLLITKSIFAQDTLKVSYQENYPMCYKTASGDLKGIEVEILEEYIKWMKVKKGTSFVVSYTPNSNFEALYSGVKGGKNNVIGMGMVTITDERKKDISFSSPYFKNVSVLVTNGNAPSISKNSMGFKALSQMSCLTVKNSTHQKYVNELTKQNPTIKVGFEENQQKVLETISSNKINFGYVDIISFWYFVTKNPQYIKFQKPFNKDNEFFGYIFPKNFKYENSLNEFFESGFGFTSTKVYKQILENHLGYEIIDLIEIK